MDRWDWGEPTTTRWRLRKGATMRLKSKQVGVMAVLLVLSLVVAGVASAEPYDGNLDEEFQADYDETSNVVVWGFDQEGFTDGGDESQTVCAVPDGATLVKDEDSGEWAFVALDEDGNPTEDPFTDEEGAEVTLDERCMVTEVTGPNGQVNHGQVVSNTVHALKEWYRNQDDYDGPFGQLVKRIAQTDWGKEKDDEDDAPDLDEGLLDFSLTGEGEDDDEGGPPEWVMDKKAEKEAATKAQAQKQEARSEKDGGPPEWVKDKKAEKQNGKGHKGGKARGRK